MNDRCIAGRLRIGQETALSSIELSRSYDFALGGVSWEQRATAAFFAASGLPPVAKLLRFKSTDPDIVRKKDECLANLKSRFAQADVLELGPSVEFGNNIGEIESLLRDKMVEFGRPLRLVMDITCLPKSYLLFILGMGFGRGYVARLDCVYAEGAYSPDDAKPDPASGDLGLISEGEWGALQIPYLDAESPIPNSRDLLVSMGGEVGLSVPFIERYEPRSLALVLIKESIVQTPEKLAKSEAVALQNILFESNVTRVDVGLCDVVSLVHYTHEFCRASSAETVSGIVLGSKPHALALGAAALDADNFEVICRVPRRYLPLDVPPTGRFALYELEDRFEPSTYL